MSIPVSRMAEGKDVEGSIASIHRSRQDDEGDALVVVEHKPITKENTEKRVGLTRQNCILCRHKDRKEIEEALAKQEITKKVVAEDLECSVEDVYEHMMNHFRRGPVLIDKDDKPKKLKELYDKKDILMTSFIQLSERLQVFIANDKFEASDTNQIIRQTEELRKLSETLADLEGELKTEGSYTLNMYVDLRNVVLGLLCDDCRKRVVEELSKTEKIMQTIDLTKVAR